MKTTQIGRYETPVESEYLKREGLLKLPPVLNRFLFEKSDIIV
jgi:hypothetical protein